MANMILDFCDIPIINHYLRNNTGDGNDFKRDSSHDNQHVSCSWYLPKLLIDFLFIYVAFLVLVYEKCHSLRKCSKQMNPRNSSSVERNETSPCFSENSQNAKNDETKEDLNIQKLFKPRIVFIHHISVWCLMILLFVCVCSDLSENLLMNFYSKTNGLVLKYFKKHSVFISSEFQDNMNRRNVTGSVDELSLFYSYLIIVGPCTAIIGILVVLLFYHQIEKWRKPNYLLFVIAFFFCSGIFHCANTYIYFHSVHLSWFHVKVLVNVFAFVTTIALVGLLSHAVIHESHKQRNCIRPDNLRYLQSYSTLPSRITFYWFTSLLRLGYRHPLEEEDLGILPDEEKTATHLKRFQQAFNLEKVSNSKESFSLWKSLFKTVWSSMFIGGIFRLLADFIGFIPPLGIESIVAYTELNYTIQNSRSNVSLHNAMDNEDVIIGEYITIYQFISNGYVMSFVVLLASFLQSTFSQCSTFLVNSEGIHIKFALQALIYQKSLTLSPTKNTSSDLSISNHPTLQSSEKEGLETSAENCAKEDMEASNLSSASQSIDTSSTSNFFDNGLIVNVMSEDANNIMMFFWMAHFIWAIPLKLAVLMTLLYWQLGYSALIGAGICILIMIPLQFLIGTKMSRNSKQLMEQCDERLRTTSEILQGIKILKLHGWELIFSNKVHQIREKELRNLDKDLLFRSIMTFLTHISSVLMTVVTFGLYPFIESEKLEPPKVFAGLALFNQLTVPLFIFPIIVPVVIDALVSTRRVRDFLLLPEVTSYFPDQEDSKSDKCQANKPSNGDINLNSNKTQNLTVPVNPRQNSDLQTSPDSVFVLENIEEDEEDASDSRKNSGEYDASAKLLLGYDKGKVRALANGDKDNVQERKESFNVSLKDACFSWDSGCPSQNNRNCGLSNITVQIPKEKLTVIVGPTGSGKSAFVSAILGEMHKTSGEVSWNKGVSIAYAAQKPWILNASVRENILFGKSFKPARYKKVIQACALQPDLDILSQKDMTEIGQKGINLSGGQKQRIAIARALYSNANVVILDDPLSALDVEVAHHVFNSGIMKFLLRSRRTVILVTHHLPVLQHAHHIIAMELGRVRIQGTLSEIQKTDPECYKVWLEMITRKEHELKVLRETKTAKERWTLLKLVSKVGIQLKYNRMAEKSGWNDDEETRAQLGSFKRKGTFRHYKHLSHDMLLPSDECHDEMMTPLLRRRAGNRISRNSRTSASSGNHIQLQRMSSLQPETIAKTRSSFVGKKFKRLQSLPVNEDNIPSGSRKIITPTISVISKPVQSGETQALVASCECPTSPVPRSQDSFIKKMFSSSRKARSRSPSINSPVEKVSPSSKLSLETSGGSGYELTDDDCDDAGECLIERDTSQDEREYGKIPWKVYLSYINACGKVTSGLYLYTGIGYEVVRVITNLWLSEWSDTAHQNTDDQDKYDQIMFYYFKIYVLLSLATVMVSLSSNLLGRQAGASSREILHRRMLDRVVRCPVRFFERTPMGHIINRFSSDVAVVDRKLCVSMQRFLQFVFLCCSAIVVNAILNYWFILAAIPIAAIYYYIQRFYRFSSRELQRIQAISRGPIYSHFQETLEGLSTIRAYREQKRFTNHMLATLDAHNIADMFINVGNRWLSISLDYLGGVIVFFATLAAILSSSMYPDTVTASMVGLAINYTLLVPVYLNWVVKFLAEVEMFMNSVDRIERYTALESEDYEGSLMETSLPPDWPTKGEVLFDNISIQYGPDKPAILSNLSLNVTARQNVGICGRSGSGKSSLLMAIFRISDVTSGRILIDGVDIHKIPLLKLRSSISIIPQENILFSGTLRFNLDPEGKIQDADIWRALQSCQMDCIVKEMPGQLNAEVNSCGDTFSAGERQLLALARAILHKSKVVIMDEATSSVDLCTERTLLQAVKDAFKDSTVLTVAHRIDTIIDSDRVVVLENGKIVEDGNPTCLMKQSSSHFATMIKLQNKGDAIK